MTAFVPAFRLYVERPPREISVRLPFNELRTRILARVREAPGSSTKELALVLKAQSWHLRAHLRALENDGSIRSEIRAPKAGGFRERAYFVRIPENPAPGEALGAPAQGVSE